MELNANHRAILAVAAALVLAGLVAGVIAIAVMLRPVEHPGAPCVPPSGQAACVAPTEPAGPWKGI